MTGYDFGDVILVPLPFTDQTTSKKRPAVVVSSAVYHRERPDIVIIAVTSQLRAAQASTEITLIEWKAAGLLKPSVIKPVLATVDPSLVLRKLGRLGVQDEQALRSVLHTIVG